MTPMKRKNMRSPNSRREALRVMPRICNPFECLDNLNIRNTRTSLMTRRIARDMACFSPDFVIGGASLIIPASGAFSFSANIVASVIKYGTIAIKSIEFITSWRNEVFCCIK